MIALDTNALVRVLVEDDRDQAKTVRKTIAFAEKKFNSNFNFIRSAH